MKATVAAGPDGLCKRDVTPMVRTDVARLWFNVIMLRGYQPEAWRRNRTTLLPKDGQDPLRVSNYRPITISSVLARLYWGIVDQRLRNYVTITPRQKGFTSEAGCFNNVHVFNELLRHAKQTDGLVAVQLDVSKAFDTIPHEAIGAALRKKGLPEFVVRLVEDSYQRVSTSIRNKGDSIDIMIKRGVKQGDPLSPLLFNLIMEPLLQNLQRMSGYRVADETISVLAFADDIFLVARTASEADTLLKAAEAYLTGLGMKISVGKCACFQVKKTRDSWYLVDPGLELSCGEGIPYASAGTKLKYLGMRISPWAGIDVSELKGELCQAIARIRKLALKPHQKVRLISAYLVPHYLYQLILAMPPATFLRKLDQELRVIVRDVYHLPQSTTNGLIYCGKRDGGLGFPRLERFAESSDPIMKALATEAGLTSRLKKLANSARINWPVSQDDIKSFKNAARKQELATWAALGSQGKSVESHIDDRIGNAWLYDPSLLKPGRFITALRMRTNTTANRVNMNRAAPVADVKCRKCKSLPETLAHILGQCTVMKEHTIRRHNEVLQLVTDRVASRNREVAVTKETTYKMPSGGNLKPDLVVQSQKGVFVVDVTVRHEDTDYLARGREDKINKYGPLLPLLKRDLKADTAEILPIVVGTRGAMPKETIKCLAKLNITDRKTLITISMIALRNSIEQYHMFMDYDAPRAPAEPPGSDG